MLFFQRQPLYSAERTERTKRRFVYGAFFAVLFLSATLGVLSWGSYREESRINAVRVLGVVSFPEADVRSFVEQKLAGAYWGLFSRAWSFLYPKEEITEGLWEAFPRLAGVVVHRISRNEIAIEATEREPRYLWCGETLPPASANGSGAATPTGGARPRCFFLDKDGVAFTGAPYFSGAVYFKMYGVMRGAALFPPGLHEPPIGLSFLSAEEWARVIAFKKALEETGISPEELFLEGEGDASFIFPSGMRLVFSMAQDFSVVHNNLLAALGTEPFTKAMFLSVGAEHFEYLDARFENKIFYR